MIRSVVLGLILVISAGSCAKLMGGLRKDFDDSDGFAYRSSPTVGGKWTEKGFLGEDDEDGDDYRQYDAVGHAERNPAASNYELRSGGTERSTASYTGPAMHDVNASGSQPAQDHGVTMAAGKRYKNGARATKSDFVDEDNNEGSLWAPQGQTNFYFSKNKVRSIGDIVTVAIDNEFVRDAAAEVGRILTQEEREFEILQLAKQPATPDASGKDSGTFSSTKTNQEEKGTQNVAIGDDDKNTPKYTWRDVDLTKSIGLKEKDRLMAEIVERYPNGNYKIRGTKKIIYQNNPKLLTFVAVAKGGDISEEDIVESGKLYEYRLEAIK